MGDWNTGLLSINWICSRCYFSMRSYSDTNILGNAQMQASSLKSKWSEVFTAMQSGLACTIDYIVAALLQVVLTLAAAGQC